MFHSNRKDGDLDDTSLNTWFKILGRFGSCLLKLGRLSVFCDLLEPQIQSTEVPSVCWCVFVNFPLKKNRSHLFWVRSHVASESTVTGSCGVCVRFQAKMCACNCTQKWLPVVRGDFASAASEAHHLFKMLKTPHARIAEFCHKNNFRTMYGRVFFINMLCWN